MDAIKLVTMNAQTTQLDTTDSQACFEAAIAAGHLTDGNVRCPKYAGIYMYMGSEKENLLFKHINTRAYLRIPISSL